jgi:hydroxyacylglutathione hydrolase
MAVAPIAFVDEGLGNSAYLLDLGDGRALVVDPVRDVAPYLAAAEKAGLHVAYSVETHLHADFLTGSRELAARGAQVLASAAGGIEWPHRGLADGDEHDLGGLRLRALGTPGHTPEHLAWLVLDGDRPVALFSGGALLPGGAARTDLVAPEQTEPLARALWRSLHQRVLGLPDDLPVYPTHGAGSFCSAGPGGERTTTIGRERRSNPLLAAPTEDEFVARLLAGYGSYPPYFLRLRERNRRGPDVLGTPFPPLPVLGADDVRALVDEGAVVVDGRPVERWAAAHVPGSLSIALRPQFGTWLGWVVPGDRPLVFVLDDDQDLADLVSQARSIGYDRVAGVLPGARVADLGPVTTTMVDRPDAAPGTVIDVRQANEFAAGHVAGAVNIELGQLPAAAAGDEVPAGPLVTMCVHGPRAATGASLLEAAGRRDVAVVVPR